MRSRLPFAIYPAAILLLVALHLWAASGVSPFAATRALLVCAVVGVGACALGAAIMRDRHRGGLFATLIVILLLVGGRPAAIPIVVIPMVLLLIERYGPRGSTLNWPWIGRMVSRVTAIFALAVLLEAIQLGRPGDLVTALRTETPLAPGPMAQPSADAPDVYVILLDGYARADVLANTFGYDDSPFLDGLRSDGFEVADASHSNYLVTNLSVSSLLNYRQLADIPALQPLIAESRRDRGRAGPPRDLRRRGPRRLPEARLRDRRRGLRLRAAGRPRRGPVRRRWRAQRVRDADAAGLDHPADRDGDRAGRVLRQSAPADRVRLRDGRGARGGPLGPAAVRVRPRPEPPWAVGPEGGRLAAGDDEPRDSGTSTRRRRPA